MTIPRHGHLSFQCRELVKVRVIALQRLDLATVDPLRGSNSPHVPGEVRMPAQKELVVVTALMSAVSEECENGASRWVRWNSVKLQLGSYLPHLSQTAFDRIPIDEAS